MKKLIRYLVIIILILTGIISGCNTQPAQTASGTETEPALPGQTPEASPTGTGKVIDVETSYHASAAVLDTGALYIWGDGQTKPYKMMEDVKAVSIGGDLWGSSFFYLALKNNGDLYAWGENGAGQVGNGKVTKGPFDVIEPVKILESVVQIDAGDGHSVAVTANKDLYVWGGNSHKQCSPSEETSIATPTKVMTGVRQAAAGGAFTLAVMENGDLYGWGCNDMGVLANGEHITNRYKVLYEVATPSIIEKAPIKIMGSIAAVGAGYEMVKALAEDGALYAWGNNELGHIGNGQQGDGDYDTVDAIITQPTQILTGICTLTIGNGPGAVGEDGNLYWWGNNEFGQLGDGSCGDKDLSTYDALLLTPASIMENVALASCGAYSTLAVTTDGKLYAWGNNDWGQLGNGKKGDGDIGTFDCFEAAPVLIEFDPGTSKETAEESRMFETEATDMALSGSANPGLTVSEGAVVYISTYMGPCKIDLESGYVEYIILPELQRPPNEGEIPDFCRAVICVYDNKIYYQRDSGTIVRMNRDGTNAEVIFTPQDLYSFASCCYVLEPYIFFGYWHADQSEALYRVDMETAEVLDLGEKTVSDADDYLYYAVLDYENSAIYRASLDGSNPVVIVPGIQVGFLTASDGWIYYVDMNKQLFRVRTDGTEQQELGSLSWPFALNVAGDHIYYTQASDGNRLHRMRTDGTEDARLCDLSDVRQISISAGRVFFQYGDMGYASVMPDGSGLVIMDTMVTWN